MIRLTAETLRMINSLPTEKREKVDAIVRRHIRACRKNGFLPESLERVFIEAIEMVEQENYDLVLMDVHMPEIDGLTATQLIRRNCKYRPWIVAMTANVLPEDRKACFEAGMNDYLSKPFKVKDIVQILLTYMRNNMEGDPTLADL